MYNRKRIIKGIARVFFASALLFCVTTPIKSNATTLSYTPQLSPDYPKDVMTTEKSYAQFSVRIVTHGNPVNYSYQWYENGVAINQATKSTYRMLAEKEKDGYTYHCSVKNNAGTVLSRKASLRVLYMPVINAAFPQDVTSKSNTFAVMTTSISSNGNPDVYTYQWYQVSGDSALLLKKETNPTLSIPVTKTKDNTKYYCIVSNGAGSTRTRTAKLSVVDDFDDYAKVYVSQTLTWNGKKQTPSITVRDKNGTVIYAYNDGAGYGSISNSGVKIKDIVFKGNRKDVGTYKVTITLSNGLKTTKTYKIVPRRTSLSSVSSGKKKSMTVKWKKQSSQTSGYQIQYATNKSFKNPVSVTVKGNKTTAKTIKGLKSKKTYYVRIRTYKKISNKNYYSSWTAPKKLNIK